MIKSSKLMGRALIAGLFTSALALSGQAVAAKLGVRVLDASSGLPVAHASVCIGTADKPALYGTGVTSYDGVALYNDVPDRSVLITVSKRNFRGISLHKPPKGNNVVLDILVTEGLSSKRCRALKLVDFKKGISGRQTERGWPLKITGQTYFPSGPDGLSFLTYSIGKPTEYRVSTSKDFNDAQWIPYSDVMHFSPLHTDMGKTMLYFQLRKRIEINGATIDALSAVTSQIVKI